MTERQSLFEHSEAKIEGYVCGNCCPRYRKHLKTQSEL